MRESAKGAISGKDPGTSVNLGKLGEKSMVMKSASVLIAAAALVLGAMVVRADEPLPAPRQVPPDGKIPPAPRKSAPAAQETLPAPKKIAPATEETLPAPTRSTPPIEINAADFYPAGCASCASGYHLTCQQLKDWLFYVPSKGPGPCSLCKQAQPCCTPPLYAFFLCQPHGAMHAPLAPLGEQADCSGCGHMFLHILHRPSCCQGDQAEVVDSATPAAATAIWEEPAK